MLVHILCVQSCHLLLAFSLIDIYSFMKGQTPVEVAQGDMIKFVEELRKKSKVRGKVMLLPIINCNYLLDV